MSTASLKNQLKKAREAIITKNWNQASEITREILDSTQGKDNYNALVFHGLATFNLKNYEASDIAYSRATTLSPAQPLAWQGWEKSLETRKEWIQVCRVLEAQMQLYHDLGDSMKLADVLEKYIKLQREEGTRPQILAALSLALPSSPYYPIISLLPVPTPTDPLTSSSSLIHGYLTTSSLSLLEEVVSLTERKEKEEREKEVEKRRTRLGAGKRLTKEETEESVLAEHGIQSKLPDLYGQLMNHPRLPIENLRETESKLLTFKMSLLYALPSEQKELKNSLFKEVEEICTGLVLIGIPLQFAWEFWFIQDHKSLDDYPWIDLRRYIAMFPLSPLTSLLIGYHLLTPTLTATLFSFLGEDHTLVPNLKLTSEEEVFKFLLDGFDALPESLIAHRIMAEVYNREKDWAVLIEVSTAGLEIVQVLEKRTGRKYEQSRTRFQLLLAVSYTHFYSPKHHLLATPLLSTVLSVWENESLALMSQGYIAQSSNDHATAREFFTQVMDLEGDIDEVVTAKEEAGWSAFMVGDAEVGLGMLEGVREVLEGGSNEIDDEAFARVSYRIGQIWESLQDYERAYASYRSALLRYSTFAPALTSLGKYHSQYSHPIDIPLASRYYQRAFELSAREVDAGRWLADSFADEEEWDLVEVIARRCIEGEGGLEGGLRKEVGGKCLEENVWAWKALGGVELSRGNWIPAIHAFQTALRTSPGDITSWLRLSEAYAKSGKQAAALKTLARAEILAPDEWMVLFAIGDVRAQLGLHEEAVKYFDRVLHSRPTDAGVLFSLSQSWFEVSKEQVNAGMSARALSSVHKALDAAWGLLSQVEGFKTLAWKQLADICLFKSRNTAFFDSTGIKESLERFVVYLQEEDTGGRSTIQDVTSISSLVSPTTTTEVPLFLLKLSSCALKYRHQLLVGHDPSTAAALHDLSIALHHLASHLADEEKKQVCIKQAVGYLKSAIRLAPRKAALWSALGTIAFDLSGRLSQHAFIMAMEIEPSNPVTWSNLGFLYYKNSRVEEAADAFLRAQILDPDCSLAWMGQGVIATERGQFKEARLLFEHAVTLSRESLLDADLLYSTSTFSMLKSSSQPSVDSLHGPAFALRRYIDQRPNDASALHLSALFLERLGQYDSALFQVARCVEVLEEAYEMSEDTELETNFAIAQTTLARLKLETGREEECMDASAGALGLVPEGATTDEINRVVRAHAGFLSGIAAHQLGDDRKSIEMFHSALAEMESAGWAADRAIVGVLLSQALWKSGEKEQAQDNLFDCLKWDSENIDVLNTLAALGMVTSDDDLLDAALTEMASIPLQKRLELDSNSDAFWLQFMNNLLRGNIEEAKQSLSSVIHTFPSSPKPRLELARLLLLTKQNSHSLQLSQSAKALSEMKMLGLAKGSKVADSSALDREDEYRALLLEVAALGEAEEAKRLAQRIVMLRPWEEKSRALLESISQ